MIVSSGLVLLMVPGLGLFYSGVSEKCSALSMMWLSMMTTPVVGIQVPYPLTQTDQKTLLTNLNVLVVPLGLHCHLHWITQTVGRSR